MALTDFRRGVGVVGLAWSGKTVFLTSLLQHLRNHDPERFVLSPGKGLFKGGEGPVQVQRFEELDAASDLPRFNLEANLDALRNHGGWPDKTTDAATFRCRFRRSDWTRAADLTFLDFPGERVADAIMLDADFAEWSDRVLKMFRDERRYRQAAADFLALPSDASPAERTAAYRLVLGRLVCNYAPLISPSTFLLGRDASTPRGRDPQALANERVVGLDAERQFCPLPAEVRAADPTLSTTLGTWYEAYRDAVPRPLFRALQRCHRLVVLADIPGTLAANTGRFNDAQSILADLVNFATPDRGGLARVGMFLAGALWPDAWRPKGISRVAYAATKADLVVEPDVTRLVSLLEEMVPRAAKDRRVKQAYFACSAVVSTRYDKRLFGYPAWSADARRTQPPAREEPMRDLNPSRLPESWPDEWHEGDYVFPEVWPLVPKRKGLPPPQTGLDRVLDFLLAESLAE